ncbi:MAG: 3-hydroxybutyryl-CoA dehydrogenase [Thermaerobacter sp.]|nr:3-hydroxybutyryl-CoA dehydrogenase [Thermaerobacter sp.]
MRRVFVVGAGQMGSGIAQVAAQAGREVTVRDVQQSFLDRGKKTIETSLGRLVKRGSLTEEQAGEALSRIRFSLDIEPAREADLCIEAILERYEEKAALWRDISAVAPERAVLASNTSSLPITRLATNVAHPERFIGMHFMNPVPVMQLVEVITGLATAEETTQAVEAEAKEYGKITVRAKDFPGFVSNRVLMPLINEAVFTLYEGVASAPDIDTVARLGMNHPMGPLQLADFIGLDTCLYILEVLYEGFGDPKYRPCPLLRQYVQAGYYGRKSGRGFYTYA